MAKARIRKGASDIPPAQIPYVDIGISGVARYGAISRVYEEFLRELQGPTGMKLYKEQINNCPITGAFLFALQHLARSVTWRVDPSTKPGVDPRLAQQVADRLSGALFDDLDATWPDQLSEILSMAPYGWAVCEMTWKRCNGSSAPTESMDSASQGEKLVPPPLNATRGPLGQGPLPEEFVPSKFSDGLLAWRSWGLRSQDTLFMWEWDDQSRAQVMQQMAPPDYRVRRIPLTKCLHFRTQVAKNNPEGVSVLRHSMPSYLLKKNALWIEGVGMERDLAGYPVFQVKEPDPTKRWVPPDIWNPNDPQAAGFLAQLKNLARSVKRDEQEGMVLPWWVEFKLLGSSGSRRQFDTNLIIQRYEQRILMSVLADFIMLGHDAVGSKALASTKGGYFTTALSSFLDIISATINRFAFPEFMKMNGMPEELTPVLMHGDIEEVPIEALGAYIANLAKAGMPLFPDGDLERQLREAAKLPTSGVAEAPSTDASEAQEAVGGGGGTTGPAIWPSGGSSEQPEPEEEPDDTGNSDAAVPAVAKWRGHVGRRRGRYTLSGARRKR